MAFAVGTTEQELMKQRANTLREIEARGGKDKAKNYAQRLQQIDQQLSQLRKGGNAAPPAAAGNTPTPPTTPASDPAPLGQLPGKIENVQQGINAEKTVADAEAKGQISYGNLATESNPFGTQTIGFTPDGRPISEQTLSGNQADILSKQENLSKMGSDYAARIAEQAGLGQAFNPQTDQRIAGGDLMGWRKGQQEQLESYLSRNFERDKARDLNELETRLYNRGIPLDRQAEAYNRAIEGLNEDYNSRRANAAAQALQFGGQEARDLYNMNEGTIQNQLNQAAQVRGQNVNDVQTMSKLGTGVIVPQFNQFRGATYDIGSPMGVQNQLTAARQSQQQINLQKQQLARQGGGRGAVGNSGATAQSPFIEA